MKKLLLPLILATAASAAHADWSKLEHASEEFSLYVDRDSRKSSGVGLFQMWHLLDYKTSQEVDGKPFRSLKGQDEYDCDRRVRRDVLHMWHQDGMGNSHNVKSAYKPGPWLAPEPGSAAETLMRVACGDK